MCSFVSLSLLAFCIIVVAVDNPPASAQGSHALSSSGYSCAAQDILDACLTIEKPQLADCEANDWNCLCTQSNNVLTCYNNCPNDSGAFGAQQTKISYCNAANVYGSSVSTLAESTSVSTNDYATSLSVNADATSVSANDYAASTTAVTESTSSATLFSSPTASSKPSAKTSQGTATRLAIKSSVLFAIVLVLGTNL